MKQISSPKA